MQKQAVRACVQRVSLSPPTSPSGLSVCSVSFPVGDFVILSLLLYNLPI